MAKPVYNYLVVQKPKSKYSGIIGTAFMVVEATSAADAIRQSKFVADSECYAPAATMLDKNHIYYL